MRTLLFIAYYLPPMGSSGVQRPLKMLKYLPEFGWNPVVLAPETGLYHTLDPSLAEEMDSLGLTIHRVPGGTPFHRNGGKAQQARPIPEWLAKRLRWLSAFRYLPDNKVGWVQPAFEAAAPLIEKYKPELIFATSPPPSNLILAKKISEAYRLPVVYDFRDDWVGNHQQIYPTAWHQWKMQELERETLKAANGIVTVNGAISRAIQSRNPDTNALFRIIPNGFDHADLHVDESVSIPTNHVSFLYSGRFYGENQPDPMLKGLAAVLKSHPEWEGKLRLNFQGGLDTRHRALFKKWGIDTITRDMGYVAHGTAVANLKKADVLWLVATYKQGGAQVSTGKIFEYMAAGKPIFAIAEKEGEISGLLRDYGPSYVATFGDDEDISATLEWLITHRIENKLPPVNWDYVNRFSRKAQTQELAQFFDEVSATDTKIR